MSIQRCTIWSWSKPDVNRLAEGFDSISRLLGLETRLIHEGRSQPGKPETWEHILNAFPEHAFSGQAKWAFECHGKITLQGVLTWPIINPGNLPATLEFDFAWGGRTSKKYSFFDVSLLVRVLHALCVSVSATSLLVEGKRLPPELVDARYQRFRRLHNEASLTNVDWVFGLTGDDPQNQLLESRGIDFVTVEGGRGFIVYALSESPLNYNSPADMAILNRVETVLGLA